MRGEGGQEGGRNGGKEREAGEGRRERLSPFIIWKVKNILTTFTAVLEFIFGFTSEKLSGGH